MAELVLQEINLLLYNGLKMKSLTGRMVTAYKRLSIKVLCPAGAFDSIVQSFNLKPRWTATGILVIDDATGGTVKSMIGPNCWKRAFPTYTSVIEETDPVKMKWMVTISRDHQGICRRESHYIQIRLICRSQIAPRSRRVQRMMN